MKVEKFKISNLVKEFIVRIDNNLTNFPKREIELKNKIKNTSYDLLYIIYQANVYSEVSLKKQYAETAIAQVKYLDFLLNLCYDKQIINSKKYVKFGEILDDIARHVVTWISTFK
ncbi:MAG: four helix bundle protein [Clostridia bacterium]|nr:four helix bundle protein [Clostridia bacterium]